MDILSIASDEKKKADKPPASELEPAVSATLEHRDEESSAEPFDLNIKNKDLLMTYGEDEQVDPVHKMNNMYNRHTFPQCHSIEPASRNRKCHIAVICTRSR